MCRIATLCRLVVSFAPIPEHTRAETSSAMCEERRWLLRWSKISTDSDAATDGIYIFRSLLC